MGSLGPLEIGLIILAILLLFGYKKLPDASRSLGRSLRIFKGEMKGMKDEDARENAREDVRTRDAAQTTPVRGEISAPVMPAPTTSADGDLTAQLHEEARLAEARAAELRARAEQTRTTDGYR
jgi:sec-independent protein translocase protein TatA